ncbi:MAG TPA: OB-fold domain-containing protein [Acidimicrobiales bacterium]|nr:OB-fold domain-containing protein [Acidimicrobiales bacterium]
MKGILAFAGYVPHHRLERSAISDASGTNAGKGTRSVASYDEDTTTMGVEAARLALRPLGDAGRGLPRTLWFSTTAPAYLDKTNAAVVHAALRLDRDAAAVDALGSVRSAVGALRAALDATTPTLVVSSDTRTGLPTSGDEREGGDGAAALLVGEGTAAAPVLAEHLGGASVTEEFLDRWRTPGEARSKLWEERFGELHYGALVQEAWKLALDDAGVATAEVAQVVVSGLHARAVRQAGGKVGAGTGGVADDLVSVIGNPGAAQPALLLARALEQAEPGRVVALVVLADGADVLLFRTTEALDSYRPARPVDAQVAAGRSGLRYLTFLSWKGMVALEPPRRPEPARASASAAARNEEWKFGFVGSRDRSTGAVHLPPARVSYRGGAVDDMAPQPMADATGTVVTFTVDRLAYSPSPPIVFAVVDFDPDDGGGRLPMELTDVAADEVRIGDRVEMTFRRLNQADGIQNYFWKARPVPGAAADEAKETI